MAGVVIPKLHGRFTTTSTSNNFTINEDAAGNRIVTLDVAGFFIRGYTGEGTESGHTDAGQLVEHIQARTRAAGPGPELDTFTCTVSNTGFVTFAVTGGITFTVTWTETALRDLLGFTGNLAGAGSYTATNQHRYGWYPNTGIATSTAHPNRQSMPSSDARVQRAPSGRVVTTAYGEFGDNEFEFRWVEDEYLVPVGLGGTTITNRDFETFWRDVLRIGERFRFYPDRTTQLAPGGSAPWEYVGAEKIVKDGLMKAKPEADNYSRYWRFVLDVMNYSAT